MGPNIRFGEIAVPARQLATGERFVGNGLSLVKRTRQQFTNGLLDFELQMVQVDLLRAEQLPPTVPFCYFTAHDNCRCASATRGLQHQRGVLPTFHITSLFEAQLRRVDAAPGLPMGDASCRSVTHSNAAQGT